MSKCFFFEKSFFILRSNLIITPPPPMTVWLRRATDKFNLHIPLHERMEEKWNKMVVRSFIGLIYSQYSQPEHYSNENSGAGTSTYRVLKRVPSVCSCSVYEIRDRVIRLEYSGTYDFHTFTITTLFRLPIGKCYTRRYLILTWHFTPHWKLWDAIRGRRIL